MKIRKLFSISLLLSVMLLSVFSGSVTHAINQDDLNSIRGFTPFFDPNASQCSNSSTGVATGSQSVDVSGSTIKIAYAYFTANGFSPAQAAGIVGNLDWESTGVDPTKWEDGGGGGYGIAQWTPPTSMRAWVSAKGGNPDTLGGTTGKIGQLDFLLYDLKNSDTQTYKQVQSDPSVVAATTDFMNGYERPSQQYAALNNRIADAQAIFAQYSGLPPGQTSTTTSGGNCSSAGGPVNAQGCSNPWAKAHNLAAERIDMGVDYNATGGSPILAICPGVVAGTATGGTGWDSPENTQGCVAINITSGAYTGKTYYVCEDIIPTVKVGDKVQAGQEIATFKTSPTGLETGWSVPNGLWSPLAAQLNQECTNGDPGCWSGAAGVSFNKLIVATGGKSGIFVPGAPKQTMPPGYP